MPQLINQQLVKEFLDYEPSTGRLLWKHRSLLWFKSERDWKIWNTKWAGHAAFTAVSSSGHLTGRIFNKTYLAHRIIWLWMTGQWSDIIDHDDGEGTNNRWVNLINGTQASNMKNQKLSKANSSGYVGVALSNTGKRFQAYVTVKGKRKHLGYFSTALEASQVRELESLALGFNHNHGRSS